MPPKIAAVQESDESWAGLCECGYNTRGWPTKAIATERIRLHEDEHVSFEENEDDPSKWRLMNEVSPLNEFLASHGLIQSPTNQKLAVFPEGVKPLKPASSGAED